MVAAMASSRDRVASMAFRVDGVWAVPARDATK